MVMAILGILFVASKQLFVNQNKNIIDSEMCMNKLEGKISSYFFNTISWKKQYQQGTSVELTGDNILNYNIFLRNDWGGDYSVFEVWLDIIDFTGNKQTVDLLRRGPGTELPVQDIGCSSKQFVVLLSWVVSNSVTTISLIKNLQGDSSLLPMQITKQSTLWWALTTVPISSTIDLVVCNRNADWSIIRSECTTTRSLRFEIATQSFKTNTCLGIDRTTNICANRTVTNRSSQ